MKLKFGVTDWWTLTNIEHSIRVGPCKEEKINAYRREIAQKMMDGLARAIRAEINRAKMAGEPTEGRVTFELDLKLERFDMPEPKQHSRRSMLAEFEEILGKKPPAKLLEW
jgi:hypothetical protein